LTLNNTNGNATDIGNTGGALTLTGLSVGVTGDITANNNLTVTGATTLNGNVNLGDGSPDQITVNTGAGADLSISESGLTRADDIVINTGSSKTVTMDGGLSVAKSAAVTENLTVNGNATLGDDKVLDVVTIKGVTDVKGNATINTSNGDGTTSIGNTGNTLTLDASTMTVGATTINTTAPTITTTSATSNTINATTLTLNNTNGNATGIGNAGGALTLTGVTVSVTGNTTLNDNLTVTGTANLNGTSNLNGNTTLGNADGDQILVNTDVQNDLYLYEGGVSRNGDIFINTGSTNKVTLDGSLEVSESLTVNGNTTLGTTNADDFTLTSSGLNVATSGVITDDNSAVEIQDDLSVSSGDIDLDVTGNNLSIIGLNAGSVTDELLLIDPGTDVVKRKPLSDLLAADAGITYNESGSGKMRLGSANGNDNPLLADRWINLD
ncbi:MAG: hypothetical protein EBV83_10060, partial [Verrucomicrobia bacterium]|nr:hypothetical protein [Verrucomicrobiota bacterium]